MKLIFVHGLAKLSRKQVKDIRERYRRGERQVNLAREFGVTQSTISRVVNGIGYRAIEVNTEVLYHDH